MTEENNQSNQSQENNPSEQDNRLPYEAPKLRKHGKINDATKAVPVVAAPFDGIPPRIDLS